VNLRPVGKAPLTRHLQCNSGAAALRSTLVLAATSGVFFLLIASCESPLPTLTSPEMDRSPSGERPSGDAPRLSLPPPTVVAGFTDLEISVRLRTVAVPFPEPDEVGICHTQVTKRDRPVPFELGHIEVQVPSAAWDEGAGESALIEYRLRGRNGMLLEAARCRIPRSRLAAEHVFSQFSRYGSEWREAGRAPASGRQGAGTEDGWKVIVGPGSPLRHPALSGPVVAMTEGGDGPDPCIPGPDDDPLDPEEPSEHPCELEEILVSGDESCDNQFHDYDPELEECACPNGSEAEDCWLEGDGPGDGNDPPGDGGGSGGGGGGGGGDGGGHDDFGYPEEECRPYLNPDCVHRYMDEWTQEEFMILQATVMRLAQNGCNDIRYVLEQYAQDGMLGLWDARMYSGGVPTQVRYGRVANQEPAEIYFMFILAWSGANQLPEELADPSWGWNLHRTLAHEATHVVHPDWEHWQIEPYVEACLGDLYTPMSQPS
jgi:hypothetical protein